MEQPGECNPFFVLKCSTRQKNTVHYLHYFCRTNIYMIWNQTISFVGQDMNLLCHQCSSHLFFSYELDLIWLEFLQPLLKFHSAVVAEPKESKHVAASVLFILQTKSLRSENAAKDILRASLLVHKKLPKLRFNKLLNTHCE